MKVGVLVIGLSPLVIVIIGRNISALNLNVDVIVSPVIADISDVALLELFVISKIVGSISLILNSVSLSKLTVDVFPAISEPVILYFICPGVSFSLVVYLTCQLLSVLVIVTVSNHLYHSEPWLPVD